MTKQGRLSLLAKLTTHYENNSNGDSKFLDYPDRENPVIGEYNNGTIYRYQVLLANGNIASINEYGNSCYFHDRVNNDKFKLANLFADNDCLGIVRLVDKRIGNLRDSVTRKKRKLCR